MMHELAMAGELAALAEQEAERLGASTVRRLHVAIGALRQIQPQMLADAFECARAGRLAQCELDVRVTTPRVVCLHCGAEESVETFETRCRACGSTDAAVRGGDEVELTSIEFESDPRSAGTRTPEWPEGLKHDAAH